MRAVSLATVLGMAVATSACVPDKDTPPSWQKPPASWNPKGDTLTFGEKNLEAFNGMSPEARAAHVEALKQKPGAFSGQGRFQSSSELGANIDDRQHGKYELLATVEEPVLFEITVDYELFSDENIGKGFAKGTYLAFTGTLADVEFRDETKPRKLIVKVKDATVTRLQD